MCDETRCINQRREQKIYCPDGPRQCLLVLLVKAAWRQDRAPGKEDIRVKQQWMFSTLRRGTELSYRAQFSVLLNRWLCTWNVS